MWGLRGYGMMGAQVSLDFDKAPKGFGSVGLGISFP